MKIIKLILLSSFILQFNCYCQHQSLKSIEQIALDFFATEILPSNTSKKNRIYFSGKLNQEKSRFVNMCFKDYKEFLKDSMEYAVIISDNFDKQKRGDSSHSSSLFLCVKHKQRDQNINKIKKKDFLLKVNQANSLNKELYFVEIILNNKIGSHHFYIELNENLDVNRFCDALVVR